MPICSRMKNRLPAAVSVEAIANAVAHGRDLLLERLAVSASRRDDLAGALRSFIEGVPRAGYSSATAVTRSAKTAFVFSGMEPSGLAWGATLSSCPGNSAITSRKSSARIQMCPASASMKLTDADDLVHQIVRTEVAQPLLFAIQVALAKCLMERGLQPAALIGHSVGEWQPQHMSGALDIHQAASVVRARFHHQEIVRGLGRMAALQVSEADAVGLIADGGLKQVVVAAINSPRSVTIAGDGDDVRAFGSSTPAHVKSPESCSTSSTPFILSNSIRLVSRSSRRWLF